MPFAYELIIIFWMLVFNAIFAAYEMALASVSKVRLSLLAQQKKKGAEDALYMKERIEASLAVVQLGITFVGAVAAASGGAGANQFIEPQLSRWLGVPEAISEILALILIIIPLSCISIIFAELVPKTYALNHREWVCLSLSPGMKVLSQVFYPVITFFEQSVKFLVIVGSKRMKQVNKTEESHSLHELRSAASMAKTSRVIGARQERIVISASELSFRCVGEILIPLEEISMISAHLTLSEALVKAHLDMHTRYPVCSHEGDLQSIMGYVNFKDIIFALHANPANPTLQGIVRPIKSVKETAKISTVLEDMIQSTAHIALVATEDGTILGMVTLEDLLEEVVGDIQDEYDRLPTYVHPYLSGWLMGGGVPMTLVASTTGLEKLTPVLVPSQGRGPTLAEWCVKQKGETLKSGETFETEGLLITVRKLRRNQLSEGIVTIKQDQNLATPNSK